MRRKYKYQIGVYLRTPVDEAEGGGKGVLDIKQVDSWCNITPIPRGNLTDYGLDISQRAMNIELLKRNDFDYEQPGVVFEWKGKKWIIEGIDPIGVKEEEYSILAASEQ